MLLACIGCTGGTEQKTTSAVETTATETEATTTPVGSGKLRVEVFDFGDMPADYGTAAENRWTQYIKDNFAKPNGIELTYTPVIRSEEATAINTMMAAQNAPDIIFTYNYTLFYTYAQQGALTDLKGYLDDVGTDLRDLWGEEMLSYGAIDGKIYTIFGKRAPDMLGTQAHFIRKDWLDNIEYILQKNANSHYHMSVEDLEDALYNFQEKDFDNTGMQNFPFGMAGFPGTNASSVLYSFINADNLTNEMKATYLTTPGGIYLLPEMKDAIRWLNKMYNDGLMDPEWAVDTTTGADTLDQQIASGRIGYWPSTPWFNLYPAESIHTLYENNPKAEVVAFQLDNQYGTEIKSIYAPTALAIMVPSFSKSAREAVMYLNWQTDIDNDTALRYGIKGEHWEDKNGIPTAIDKQYNAKTMIRTNQLTIVYNGDAIRGLKAWLPNLTEECLPIAKDSYAISQVGGIAPYAFKQSFDSETKYSSNLSSKADELIVRSIMAGVNEFDSVYDGLLTELKALGLQEILDEKSAVYRKQN